MPIRSILKKLIQKLSPNSEVLLSQVTESKILAAKALINQMKSHGIYDDIHEVEFKVFSQFGDDGIIQYLIHHIPIKNKTFIEFGVQNYVESNTRFLLINNNWSGLIIDGDQKNIDYIKKDSIYWKYDLTAICEFLDKENINNVIKGYLNGKNISHEIGILSIDIDGNDYWIWESIAVVEPAIVIIEYNSHFGSEHAVTIPYKTDFERSKAHYSCQYWGASLKALSILGKRKGYQLVGCCTGGNNAYFIRENHLGRLIPMTVEDGYVESKFRDSRDQAGNLSFLSGNERLKIIEDMDIYDVERNVVSKIKSLP